MSALEDVSDTALWVAEYRARESERPDALFRDPLARKLAGDRGALIDRQISHAHYIEWSVVIRTRIIDEWIQRLVTAGVDTVLNLGAGLDTRPYRMQLPSSLKWIEIDFPKIIERKNARLAGEKPQCQLSRIASDLSRTDERRRLFAEINASSQKVLVLTEGVVPYLTNEAAGELADDLHAQPRFERWIVDYNSSELTKRMQRPKMQRQMRNAPLRFAPSDWHTFFDEHGWRPAEMRYIGETAIELDRPPPHPWVFRILQHFIPRKWLESMKRMNGYALLEKR